MIVRVRQWYGGRTQRERWLLLAMAALAAPVLLWILLLRPLAGAEEQALERHLEAVDRHGRVLVLAEAIEAGPSRARIARDVDLQLLVTEAAGLAGVALTDVAVSGPDSVSVTLTNSSAPAATEWLRSLEARGLVVEELRLAPAGDRVVNVSARVGRR